MLQRLLAWLGWSSDTGTVSPATMRASSAEAEARAIRAYWDLSSPSRCATEIRIRERWARAEVEQKLAREAADEAQVVMQFKNRKKG